MKKGGMMQTQGKGIKRYPATKRAPKAPRGGQSRYGGLRPSRGGKHSGGRKR